MISQLPFLSIILLLPLVTAICIVGIDLKKNFNNNGLIFILAILGSTLTLAICIYLLFEFNYQNSGYQFIEYYTSSNKMGLVYHIGVDSTALYLICLTAFLTLICIIYSFSTTKDRFKELMLFVLLIETLCIGVFCSINLLLFFIFFEFSLVPMYLIIGIWGGENRIYAAFKFFLYTFFGSIFLLLSIIYIYTQFNSFNLLELSTQLPQLDLKTQQILWFLTFIAFAIKTPMFPFHTWLPYAHVQAPTIGSVILAGIMLKLGTYALFRISISLFPLATQYFSTYGIYLSGIAIIYGSLVAIAQVDIKKLVAYSSVAHMGYVTGGIFSLTQDGFNGAIFQMISHGLISSALFLIIGILYERNHTKDINQYGGLNNKMPKLALLFMITMLGSIGLPGTSGFIGELLSVVGIFKTNYIGGVVSASGVILAAIYMLNFYKKVMLGPITNDKINNWEDLNKYELLTLIPLVVLIIYFGLFPNIIIDGLQASTQHLAKMFIL